MPNVLRNVLAVVAGIVIGSIVNMAIVTVGPMVVPPPEGVDLTTPEGIKAGMHLFQPKHFVTPFLAHALGTLVGAFLTYVIAASHNSRLAYVIGAFFLVGGVAASTMFGGPAWFIALDLIVAYLPMAWLGARLGARVKQGKPAVARV